MYCLICYLDLQSVTNPNPNLFNQDDNRRPPASASPLDKNLFVTFVLRKILHIPTEQLEFFLRKCPEMDDWFHLCQECTTGIEKCKEVYNEMLEAIQKFKALQEEIVKTVKSSKRDNLEGDGRYDEKYFVMNASRDFVFNNEYEDFLGPFVMGDSLAKAQLASVSSCCNSVVLVKKENESVSSPVIDSVCGADPLQNCHTVCSAEALEDQEIFFPGQKIVISYENFYGECSKEDPLENHEMETQRSVEEFSADEVKYESYEDNFNFDNPENEGRQDKTGWCKHRKRKSDVKRQMKRETIPQQMQRMKKRVLSHWSSPFKQVDKPSSLFGSNGKLKSDRDFQECPHPSCSIDITHIKFCKDRRRHVQDCFDRGKFQCKMCTATFSLPRALNAHLKKVHLS